MLGRVFIYSIHLLAVLTSPESSKSQLTLSELFYFYYTHPLLDKRYENILREAILNKTPRALTYMLFIVTEQSTAGKWNWSLENKKLSFKSSPPPPFSIFFLKEQYKYSNVTQNPRISWVNHVVADTQLSTERQPKEAVRNLLLQKLPSSNILHLIYKHHKRQK